MPPVVAAAAIGGAAALGGSYLQSRASNKATKAQQQANDKALQHAQQQEALRRADYERAYAQWQAGRNQLLQRYGLPIQQAQQPYGQPPQTPIPGSAVPRGQPPQAPRGGNVPIGYHPFPVIPGQGSGVISVAAPISQRTQRPGTGMAAAGSLADVMAQREARAAQMANWDDWRMYGLPT